MVVNGMSGIFAGQSFSTDKGVLVFGRSASSCNIPFPDSAKGISRTHCKIEQNGMVCTITDLGSSYGTFVNGIRIQQYAPTTLKNGDTFYLGDKSTLFSCQELNASMPVGVIPSPASVTYLNGNGLQQNTNGASNNNAKKTPVGAIIAVIVATIFTIIAIMVGLMMSQQNRELQQQLQKEQNKGFGEEVIDVIDAWFD